MFLFLARHAWAGHFGDPAWPDDFERPLNAEGIARYRQVLERLTPRGFTPTVIATSPYVRCRQTADLIAESSGGEVVELDALAIGAEIEALLHWTNEQATESVCWVGHNPDMPYLTAALTGGGNPRFAKGSVAAIRFYGDAAAGVGELYWLATAKLLGV